MEVQYKDIDKIIEWHELRLQEFTEEYIETILKKDRKRLKKKIGKYLNYLEKLYYFQDNCSRNDILNLD